MKHIFLFLFVLSNFFAPFHSVAQSPPPDSNIQTVSEWGSVTPDTVISASPEQIRRLETALALIPSTYHPPRPVQHTCIAAPDWAADDLKTWAAQLLAARNAQQMACAERYLQQWESRMGASPAATLRIAWQVERLKQDLAQKQFDRAEAWLPDLLELAPQQGDYKAEIYYLACRIHRQRYPDDYQTPFQYATQAAEAALESGDRSLLLDCHTQLGKLKRVLFFGSSLRAIPNHQQAIELAIELRDTARWLHNLVALGMNYDDAHRYDLMIETMAQVAALLQTHQDYGSLQRFYVTISRQYNYQGDSDKCLHLLHLALDAATALRDTPLIVNNQFQILGQYMGSRQWERAEQTLQTITHLGHKDTNESYYALEKAKGNIPKALYYLEKVYSDVSGKYHQQNNTKLNEWETRFRTKEKQQLLDTANRQRWWLMVLSGFALLLLILATYGFWKQRRQRLAIAQQKQRIEQQAEELRGLDKIKNQFFANISHELRTPLTLILAPTESQLLQQGTAAWTEDKNRPLLQNIYNNGKHLLRLIEEILDLSKLDAHKLEVQTQPVVFKVFVQSIVQAFRLQAQQKGIYLDVQDQGIAEVDVLELDKNKLEKILYNLLSNAFKFTPEGGTVRLLVAIEQGQLLCTVSDTGRGVHPDDLPHIFERFFQSQHQDRRISGGTGIGLAFVKALTELMGGGVTVQSEWGRGTQFSIALPLQKSVVPLPEILESDDAAEHQTDQEVQLVGDFTIAIAEDHDELRAFLVELLSPQFKTIAFEHGKQLYDYLFQPETPKVDLIVSDLMMPEMDGFELLEHIKQSPLWQHIPSIILTARAGERDKLQALTIGVDDYLTKPFSATELIVRVRNLLRNYLQRIRLQQEDPLPENTLMSLDTASVPTFSPEEQAWIKALEQSLLDHISDPNFTLEQLAGLHFISERQLQRRVQKLTGLSYNDYVKEIRLQKARILLEDPTQNLSLKEVAAKVGFKTAAYFSKLFALRFGKTPEVYVGV